MIAAAIYARKSTEQPGVSDDDKSVARQVEQAREYATRKGWTVADDHVYIDDGISGAIFGAGRPGLARLLNALKPRAPFDVLIMSEESRLGREQIETSWVLKQIIDGGIRVFTYLDDRERALDSALDKVMLGLTSFASEMERERARQRTTDAMIRKARSGYCAGGKVWGYRNVEVAGPDGRRSHVTRVIDPEQAAVVRRIFTLYADGFGLGRIAKRLNADGVPPPRAIGWAPSAIREMLKRPMYRGVIVWNRSAKVVRAGVKGQRRRDEREWIRREAPELMIVSPDLAARVDARLAAAAASTAVLRSSLGTFGGNAGRPPGAASKYLLVGFARCASCGGPLGSLSRAHGTGSKRFSVKYYGCVTRDRRGPTVCANATVLRQDILDAAVLDAIRGALDEGLLRAAVARALELRRERQGAAVDRRPVVERELHAVEGRIGRLVDAIATAGPLGELIERLQAERARKAALLDEQRSLRAPEGRDGDGAIMARLMGKVGDLRRLLGLHVQRTRHVLGAMLSGPVPMVPVVENGRRGYRFAGELRLGGLLEGAGLETLVSGVAPTGFEPVFQP